VTNRGYLNINKLIKRPSSSLLRSTIMAARTLFDPQPKGAVRFFSDAKREDAYLQAGPYFLEQMRILLKDGWKRNNCNSEEVYPSFTNSEKQYSLFHHRSNQFLFDISKMTKKGRLRRVILPKTFAHFLDISNANTWREIFENSATFNAIKKGKNRNLDLCIESSPPLSNIFYLLQVLAPGMLVIYYEYQLRDADVKVSKLLPQAGWILVNIEFMSKTDGLIAATKDKKIAFHEERTARPQNNSHHSSLPGTDALPSCSLPGTDALPSSSLPGTNAPPSSSSTFPGTNAIPTIASGSNRKTVFVKEGTSAKDQKPASHKKKKKQPRSNISSYTNFSGYQKPDDYYTNGGGYEYGMCDKDCGWCGNCSTSMGY
jgi:hypothetical protein